MNGIESGKHLVVGKEETELVEVPDKLYTGEET